MDRSADTLIGRVLDGRYRVGPKIARGGMATVYEATDLRLDRTVAVKVMHEGLADDEEFVRRFQREARSAARLSHPHVVSVFDTGDDDGTLFLVMEYVPGLTLRDLIRKEAPFSPAKALALLEPVLSALAAAHDAGILHRDVKPENVLLADPDDPGGRSKVADFGLSRAINSETQHTATGGVLIGTVSYLAPEIVVNGRADARADVYAAGVVLYEMLTGRKPHQADSPIQVAYKHVHEDIPAPSAVVPGIPAYVDALVARATARDTALRPADARVLLQQVRRVRQALAQGVTDDPELLADLSPTASLRRTWAEDTGTLDAFDTSDTSDLPDRILEPQEAARLLEAEHAGVGTRTTTATRAPAPATGGSQPFPTQRSNPRPPPPIPPRHSRRGRVWLVVVLVLAVLAGLGGWYFGIARYTVAPGVVNMTEAQAKTRLDRDGLGLRITDTAYNEGIAKGHIVSTDPGRGDRVRKDGTVGAVLSLGPERHRVPDVHGKSLDDAQAALDDSKLDYGREVLRFNEAVPKGQVISTDPVAGTPEPRHTAVDVVVSRGPRPIAIPDLAGKTESQATSRLRKLGFEVDSTEVNSDTVRLGRVISQSPDSGNGQKGDRIALVVSKGPVMVEVPKVDGYGLQAATQRLESAGFRVKVTKSNLYIGVQYVVGTNPSGGTLARKGSTVTVSIV